MNKTVVVLGEARGGTSVITAILQCVGVEMNGIKAKKNNGCPKGTFEDVEMTTKTIEWKKALDRGVSLDELKEQEDKWISEWVKERSKDSLWGWKSAQTHYSFDLIKPYIDNPYIVWVTRNPFHQAVSLVMCSFDDIMNSNNQDDLEKHKISFGNIKFFIQCIANGLNVIIDILCKYPDIPVRMLAKEDVEKDSLKVASELCDFLQIEFTDEMKQKIEETIISGYSSWKNHGVEIDWDK